MTPALVGIQCEFSDSEFSAIGKLIWAFTVLEHELARAAMWLTHEATPESETLDKDILVIAGGTLKQRYSEFKTRFRRVCDDDDLAWLEKLESRFPDLDLLRNRICHGKWSRTAVRTIAFRLHDRESLRAERVVDYWQIDGESIVAHTNEVLKLAGLVALKAKTV